MLNRLLPVFLMFSAACDCDTGPAPKAAVYLFEAGASGFLHAAHEAPPSWSAAIVTASFRLRVQDGAEGHQRVFADHGGGRFAGVALDVEASREGWTILALDQRTGEPLRGLVHGPFSSAWHEVTIVHDNSIGLARVEVDGVPVALDQGRHDLLGTVTIGDPLHPAAFAFEVSDLRYHERGVGAGNCELCGWQPVDRPEPAYRWSSVFEAGSLPPRAYWFPGATPIDGVANEGYGDTAGVLARYRTGVAVLEPGEAEPVLKR